MTDEGVNRVHQKWNWHKYCRTNGSGNLKKSNESLGSDCSTLPQPTNSLPKADQLLRTAFSKEPTVGLGRFAFKKLFSSRLGNEYKKYGLQKNNMQSSV